MKTPVTGGEPGRAVERFDRSEATAPSPQNPAFVLKLEPLPGIDGPRTIRELPKRARRNHCLRCVACRELSPPASAQPAPEGLLDRSAAWLAEGDGL